MVEFIMTAAAYEKWAEQARAKLPAWCGLEPDTVIVLRDGGHVSIIGLGDDDTIAESYVQAIREDGFHVIRKP